MTQPCSILGPRQFSKLLMVAASILIIIITFPFSLMLCIKIVKEYERAVTLRLGRLLKYSRGPGVIGIIPCIDTYCKVDMRTVSFNVPPQEVLTKDLVTISVDAVVYYRIVNSLASVLNVADCSRSTHLMAATTLRNVLGTKTLYEIVSERVVISNNIQINLEEATSAWGVEIERVEIKDVRLPSELQKSMATEAEAAREAEAKVIMANGEKKSSQFIREAANTLEGSASALQIKYLLSINSVATEKSSIIVLPLPLELIQSLSNLKR